MANLKIRSLREALGMSQAALAELAHVPPQRVSVLEVGTGDPAWSELVRLAQALNVEVYDLIDRGPHSTYAGRVAEAAKSAGATLVIMAVLAGLAQVVGL